VSSVACNRIAASPPSPQGSFPNTGPCGGLVQPLLALRSWYMRGAACVSLAVLATVGVVGSTASAAGSGWHVTPVRHLGRRIGNPQVAAVNRVGTSVVAFASGYSLTLVRRPVRASKFEVAGRISARRPIVVNLTALADGRFLLVYAAGGRLLARGIDASGRFAGMAHFLATGYTTTGPLGDTIPLVVVDSDASRAVVVWGAVNGATGEVAGAVEDQAGWSSSKIFVQAPAETLFIPQLVHDSQDRFLVSVHGANGDTTAVMWGLAGGSLRWEQVTPPQATDGSGIASYNGATLASLDGTVTAGWQDASAALVVSTWDGSTWSTPERAISASYLPNGLPAVIYPTFVSDGSRAGIVWSDGSKGLLGPVKATIRASSTESWSAPLVFPHARGAPAYPEDAFWFTASGGLAGVWEGNPLKGSTSNGFYFAGLYVGHVGPNGSSATALSRTQHPNNGRYWFVLPSAAGLHTIVWAGAKGHEYSTAVTANGAVRPKQPLPACAFPGPAASNPDASPQVMAFSNNIGPVGAPGSKCPAVLLW